MEEVGHFSAWAEWAEAVIAGLLLDIDIPRISQVMLKRLLVSSLRHISLVD